VTNKNQRQVDNEKQSVVERTATVSSLLSLLTRPETEMVIVVAAAVTAAGYGVYRGGKAAVNGVQNKIEKVKDRRQRNNERQGLDFVRQKKQEEAARKERIAVIASKSDANKNKPEDPLSWAEGVSTDSTGTGDSSSDRLARLGTGDSSIRDRVARFKTGIGSKTENKPGRFSRFGKKGGN
jgi:hypothetical protein